MSASLVCCWPSVSPARPRAASHATWCACSPPCRKPCGRPLLSTMVPSSPAIWPCTASRSKPSSAIPTPPGKRAASRMPSAGCAASCRARPTSQPSQPAAFAVSLPLTTTPRANALTSARPPSPLLNCCTSSVNPPPCFRRDDISDARSVLQKPPAAAGLLFRLGKPVVERVTGAAHGADRILLAAGVEQLAQAPDMHVHGALVDIDIAAPDAVEQLFAAEHAPGILQEKFEQPVFGRSEIDRTAGAGDATLFTIQFDIAIGQHRGDALGAGAAQQAFP